MSGGDYRMYTLNSPIFGLDEDLNNFLNDFIKIGSPRFSDFSELWKKKKFIELIYGRQTQASLRDILEGIFFSLVNNFNVSSEFLRKIGSLYLIYAFYGKQPIVKQARVNVTPTIWRSLLEFIKNIASDNQWDAYYIFHRLCSQSAFRFVASQEELYPGVPLWTRSNISLPVRRTFLTKSQRRFLSASNKRNNEPQNEGDIVPNEVFDLPEYLKTNWNSIYRSVNEYIAAKERIGYSPGLSSPEDDPFIDASEDNTLWSLNLVNYKDSIAPIADLIRKFSGGVFLDGEPNTDSEEDRQEAEEDIGAKRRRLRNRKDWCSAVQR
ncbi:unnamed protein product [Rodentolepis nana]|uniref:Small nuclear RNA activating complex polypeptide 1 n=1 Tax=Rodentolepis nana TaxID=102285 RepID=A0A0R3TKB9_RODNA|nr:unnamed protein product [Rodentolepis nana]